MDNGGAYEELAPEVLQQDGINTSAMHECLLDFKMYNVQISMCPAAS